MWCGSYIESPDLIKRKMVQCFQYVITVALNYGETELHTERV